MDPAVLLVDCKTRMCIEMGSDDVHFGKDAGRAHDADANVGDEPCEPSRIQPKTAPTHDRPCRFW